MMLHKRLWPLLPRSKWPSTFQYYNKNTQQNISPILVFVNLSSLAWCLQLPVLGTFFCASEEVNENNWVTVRDCEEDERPHRDLVGRHRHRLRNSEGTQHSKKFLEIVQDKVLWRDIFPQYPKRLPHPVWRSNSNGKRGWKHLWVSSNHKRILKC